MCDRCKYNQGWLYWPGSKYPDGLRCDHLPECKTCGFDREVWLPPEQFANGVRKKPCPHCTLLSG